MSQARGILSAAMYDAIAAQQLGLITTAQLLHCGLTRHEIRRLVRAGQLVWERQGVYRCAGVPSMPEHPVLAAVLAGGGRTVASLRAAVLVHRVDGFVCRQPEITSWGGSHPRLEGVRVHRVRELPDWQRTVVNGVPVTTVARTFVDLVGTRPDAAFGPAFDDARRRKLVTVQDVLRCAEGRPKMGQLHRVMAKRLEDRSDTDFEAHVYWVIADAGLPVPQQQVPVAVPEGAYVLDHAYPEPLKIDIEIKGFGHAQDRTVFDRDSFRKVHLRRAGWLNLEITTAWTDHDIAFETRAALIERGWPGAL